MERRLLRGITTPAMVATLLFGISLGFVEGRWAEGWLQAKTVLVLLLAACSWSDGPVRQSLRSRSAPGE